MRAILEAYENTGWGYARYTHADFGDWGVALAKPARVVALASDIDGIRILSFTERGWANNQDVLVVSKNDRLAHWPASGG
jgi:hypothetical protein